MNREIRIKIFNPQNGVGIKREAAIDNRLVERISIIDLTVGSHRETATKNNQAYFWDTTNTVSHARAKVKHSCKKNHPCNAEVVLIC